MILNEVILPAQETVMNRKSMVSAAAALLVFSGIGFAQAPQGITR